MISMSLCKQTRVKSVGTAILSHKVTKIMPSNIEKIITK